ncbi:hypothetical protein PCYB_001350 [Plasmodium cynomolgi strain B]|uniref:Uncharacterized protein n=1 Tax=Plasmodium cynomolgi (strain B) TaxID=1120755 RepID=K6VJ19_PLACD|nr:hypothetical protein PCYB_001350 [Plasmodium cynomolgi strain B]GAB69387.1 hypothetical protein PCYB_001350 [Plasmodium cynomolgi strain B]
MFENMFKLTGVTTPYSVAQGDVNVIKSALGACQHNRETFFFMEPRFLQGIFVGILMFYLMLYYTRRYKNKVNNLQRRDSFTYVTLPTQGPYREFREEEMHQQH